MNRYDEIPIEARCPVCGCNFGKQLWSVDARSAARHFVLPEVDPHRYADLTEHIISLWSGELCRVVQCRHCKFCFSQPFVAGDARFYALAYPQHGYPQWKWEYVRAIDYLSRTWRPDLRILEVGAGNGAFVAELVRRGIDKRGIVCTEFSLNGRAAIEAAGIRCLAEDVRNLVGPEWEGRFEAVCMFQVLEHLDRLDDLFSRLAALLVSGGRLIVAVPNPAMIEFNELHGALRDMPPCHVGRWNTNCFDVIGQKFGFRLEDSAIEPFRWLPAMSQFVGFRLLRRAQQSGSWANRAFSIRSRFPRRAAQAFLMVVEAFRAITTLPHFHRGIGNALIVCLTKG